MTYQIKITPTAIKERKRLTPTVRQRIDRTLIKLKENPFPAGVRKLVGTQNDWRIRVGDYRILFEVDNENSIVTIWRISHRRNAYR